MTATAAAASVFFGVSAAMRSAMPFCKGKMLSNVSNVARWRGEDAAWRRSESGACAKHQSAKDDGCSRHPSLAGDRWKVVARASEMRGCGRCSQTASSKQFAVSMPSPARVCDDRLTPVTHTLTGVSHKSALRAAGAPTIWVDIYGWVSASPNQRRRRCNHC